jgi:DNA primase
MDFKDQVKESADIVRVIGEYVRLKKLGPNYKGLCPFHNEKSPSFNVHPGEQFFKCFGCGIGGDIFKFIQEIEHISFYEALKMLAERNGIPLPKRSEYIDPDAKSRGSIEDMNNLAARLFQSNLSGTHGAEARAYLTRRGLSWETVEHFGLGLSDRSNGLLRLLRQEGFSNEQLETSGLIGKRESDGSLYDKFRGRLMFPIHNESGKLIAFGGRTLAEGDDPKYLNSPGTPLYEKSSVLYNLNRARNAARKFERMVLVEGYMDAIGVAAAGVEEVVASCGTALTSKQVRAMRRHASRIVVNFDPDPAGQKATEKSILIMLEEGAEVCVLELEEGLDPDEYVKKFGPETYREKLDHAGNYFYWLADRARGHYDMRTGEGKVKAFQFLLPSIQKIPEKIRRAAVASDVAGYLGIEAGLVLEEFKRSAVDRKEHVLHAPVREIPQAEKLLLRLLAASTGVRQVLLPRLAELGAIDGFAARKIFETMIHLHENQPGFQFPDLESRLEENDRRLMAELVFADEIGNESVLMEQAESFLKRMEEDAQKSKLAVMKAQIKAAERAGNMGDAIRLTEEYAKLEYATRKGRGSR